MLKVLRKTSICQYCLTSNVKKMNILTGIEYMVENCCFFIMGDKTGKSSALVCAWSVLGPIQDTASFFPVYVIDRARSLVGPKNWDG